MQVLMPGRILERHVGGNTTYARTIAAGLRSRGVVVDPIGYGNNPISTLARETFAGLKRRGLGTVLHYVADTGPLIPTRVPSVVTVHGVASNWVSGVRSPRADRIWRTRVKAAISCTNAVVTVSESSADDVADVFGVDRHAITVIRHGIDSAKFHARHSISAEVGSKLPNEFILYVGNIEPRKNLIELVRALKTPKLSGLRIPLVIAGKPAWDSDDAMTEIVSSEKVIYLGFVSEEDKIGLMQRCAAFVFPSKYEGFGFPVLEAMAAGAPVISSSKGALREVAGPSRITEEIGSDAIADCIHDALTDSDWLDHAGKLGRAWASQFSWDDSVESHLRVYRSVVDL
ncbi:glycosyltransferase family 4 protein [Rhodococcus sp. HNM0563]|nr:glycosyltransferase family 1 protein [Rhodococcus sp. HNM0563]NLU61687.1 glycosyltransferase family 4 protein [Rhodococcus sp. HNM0563]